MAQSGGPRRRARGRVRLDGRAFAVARRLAPVHLVVLGVRPMGLEREADVVRDRQHARLDLERRDPRVFGESARDQDRGPLDDVLRRMRRHPEFGTTHDDVGLDLPAVGGPFDRRAARLSDRPAACRSPPTSRSCRCPPCASERSLANRPCCGSANHGGICRLSTLALIERAQGRVVLIRQQGHRRDLPGPMARLAILLEDRQNVLRKRDGRVGGAHPDRAQRAGRPRDHRSRSDDDEQRERGPYHSDLQADGGDCGYPTGLRGVGQ